jgi:hypothetical protein
MPVNQNLVTIKANPQPGVRGTLAPPCDLTPRQVLGRTFWDHSSSQGGWYLISDSAGHSHSRGLTGKGTKIQKAPQLWNNSAPFPEESIRRDFDDKRRPEATCHSEVKNLLDPRVPSDGANRIEPPVFWPDLPKA